MVSHSTEGVDVLVVGAGMTGVNALYRLVEEGFSTRVLEAGDGVGGTWFWNRYPGARFDSESYTYGYLFSEQLFDEWVWSEHFAGQPEIERYVNYVVDRFDLRRHIVLGARVAAAEWDPAAARWSVTTEDGAVHRARWLVAATGVLSVPYLPEVPGLDRFRGESHHTGRWPREPVDFTGKRVAIVGTSSSGVQVLPAVAPVAELVTVYQRSANWCTPLNNAPITDEEQAQLRVDFAALRTVLETSPHGFHHTAVERSAFDDTDAQRAAFFDRVWNSPGFRKLTSNYADVVMNPAANALWCEFIAAKIRSIVHDPATAERLIPTDHRYAQKRPPFVVGYYEAFNRSNVDLVDLRETPMVRVTEHGIETTAGERAFDILVWATGFDFGTGALVRMGVRGTDGRLLADAWADGPRTWAGVATAGFPNFFFPGGPHAAAGNNPRYNSDQVEFVIDLLRDARDHGDEILEIDPAAETWWTDMIGRGTENSAFGSDNYYFGTNIPGKPRRLLLNAAGRPKLQKTFTKARASGFAPFRRSRPA
ncbi:MAG: flavin-containing monooxygenase [Actinomycetota bacterium]